MQNKQTNCVCVPLASLILLTVNMTGAPESESGTNLEVRLEQLRTREPETLRRYKKFFNYLLDSSSEALETRNDYWEIALYGGRCQILELTPREKAQHRNQMIQRISTARRIGEYPISQIECLKNGSIIEYVFKICTPYGEQLDLCINVRNDGKREYISGYQWWMISKLTSGQRLFYLQRPGCGIAVQNLESGVMVSYAPDNFHPRPCDYIGLPLNLRAQHMELFTPDTLALLELVRTAYRLKDPVALLQTYSTKDPVALSQIHSIKDPVALIKALVCKLALVPVAPLVQRAAGVSPLTYLIILHSFIDEIRDRTDPGVYWIIRIDYPINLLVDSASLSKLS